MQAQRNKYLLISLIILLCLTIASYFVFNTNEERHLVDKSIFKVDALNEVNRIVLTSPESEVSLVYNGSRWIVNGKYPADAGMIDVLFATIEQAQPKRAVATSLIDSLSTLLEKSGVQVKIYKGEVKLKDFIVGGNSIKTQAFFKDPESGQVYVMAIPGYRVYVSGIFELNESGFRDKYVFAFNWQNFKSLNVEFPADPQSNFSVAMDDGIFSVTQLLKTDTAKLNTFLDNVSLLMVSEYANELTDSLLKVEPEMIIRIGDAAKRSYELKIFPGLKESSVVALVNGEGAFFDGRRIKPLLRRKSYFKKQ